MIAKKLESRILQTVQKASKDYGLLQENDRILVALSGGKDSYGLLWALMKLQSSLPIHFNIVAYHLDQGQPGHDITKIKQYLENLEISFEIEYQDTYTRVVEKTEPGKIYCSLCSRFRRAILYKAAIRQNCNKIALGHHKDDAIETLLLNLFFSGQIKSMPPKLRSDAGSHQIIRPLCLVAEEDMQDLATLHQFPIMPCQLCGSQQAQRAFIKDLLTQMQQKSPHIKGNLLSALGNVLPSHLYDPRINPLFQEEQLENSNSMPFKQVAMTATEPNVPNILAQSTPAKRSSLTIVA